MYIPQIYNNENSADIYDFISKNGFGILVNQTSGKPWATHIPLVLDIDKDGNWFLEGHISKENPQCHSMEQNQIVLAIFSGPHAYISSSWYDHENVPTWNYIAVHVYGTIKILDLDKTILSLKKLTDKYEKLSENPEKVENLSSKTMRQANGILGFQIEIESIEAVKKLSQNRDDKNYKNIISQLEKSQNTAAANLAIEMKSNRKL